MFEYELYIKYPGHTEESYYGRYQLTPKNLQNYLKERQYKFSRAVIVRGARHLASYPYYTDNKTIKEITFQDRLTNALQAQIDGDSFISYVAAKKIAKRLCNRRNSHGIGLVGPVHDVQPGDNPKISYSRKKIKRNDHKRRTKITLAKFLKNYTNITVRATDLLGKVVNVPLTDAQIDAIQNAFTPLTFKILWGQDAADIYHLPYGSPFRSCMQKGYNCNEGSGTYNDHLFLKNVGKVGLLVSEPLAVRAKIYHNDDGTWFLDRIYTDGRSLSNKVREYFDANYTYGDLNCTLFHSEGEYFPYLDHGCVERIDSKTIRIGNDGEDRFYTDGTDPTTHSDCKHCEDVCRLSDMTEIDDYHVCDSCLDRYVLIDGEYVDKDRCVFSDTYDEWILAEDATTVYVSRIRVDHVRSEDATQIHSGRYVYSDNVVELHDGDYAADWEDTYEIEYGEGKGLHALDEDCVESNRGIILYSEAVEINGSFYHKDDCTESENGMILKEDAIEINGHVFHKDYCEELEGVWVLKEDLAELVLS